MNNSKQYDVIILGTGIGGTMLGAILAKHGLSVMMIDAGSHPRFAIGEATTPDTSFRFKLLALKYGVPEISNLSTFHKLRDNISPACGVKRAFSFLYHRAGEEQNPKESHQYPTLAPPMGPDCHLFRQDTDAYMLSVALQYGAVTRQQTRVTEVDIKDETVHVNTDKGEAFTAKYIVDGAGFRSPLAQKYDLRESSDELITNSRGIFTHMIDVKLWDQVGAPRKDYGLKYPMSQTTLHHMFEGGWFWIIPFNNHLDATNPLCSVGLMLNRDKYPETGMDAEEEFFHFVNKHPGIARQFENAKSVRNWVSTPRINYHSKQMTGHRYALLPHAAGFVDPLFSSGLNITAGTLDLLSGKIIDAVKTNDFSNDNFAQVNEFFEYNLHLYDKVVGYSFESFQDYDLWDAWYRVWVIGLLIGTAINANQFLKYMEKKDKSILKYSESGPYTGLLGSKFAEFRPTLDKALDGMALVRKGERDPKEAAKAIVALFENMNYTPTFWQWSDTSVRSTPAFTVWGMTKMYIWYLLNAPKDVRKVMMGWNPLTAYGYVFKSIVASARSNKRRRRNYVRDVFKHWNKDWKPTTA